jgi:hypothetical protein
MTGRRAWRDHNGNVWIGPEGTEPIEHEGSAVIFAGPDGVGEPVESTGHMAPDSRPQTLLGVVAPPEEEQE